MTGMLEQFAQITLKLSDDRRVITDKLPLTSHNLSDKLFSKFPNCFLSQIRQKILSSFSNTREYIARKRQISILNILHRELPRTFSAESLKSPTNRTEKRLVLTKSFLLNIGS